MPFPKPDNTAQAQQPVSEIDLKPNIEVKAPDEYKPIRDFNDLDSLINELNVPKEVISNETKTTAGNVSSVFEDFAGLSPERPPVDNEKAKKTGARTAKMVDLLVSTGLSSYAKEQEDTAKYKASESELVDFSEAWSDISLTYNVDIGPIPTLITVFLIIYGPKFFKAKNDRRHNETKERLDDHEQKQTELEKVVLEQRKTIDDMNIRILEIQGLKPTP